MTKHFKLKCRLLYFNFSNLRSLIHRPFVSDDKRVVNTGSWVSEPQTNYKFTAVELDGDQIILFCFFDGNTEEDIIVEFCSIVINHLSVMARCFWRLQKLCLVILTSIGRYLVDDTLLLIWSADYVALAFTGWNRPLTSICWCCCCQSHIHSHHHCGKEYENQNEN